MTTIKATIQGRRLELDVPADWPDGTEVEVYPLEPATHRDADVMSPQGIAQVLAAMDQVEPFELTPAEQTACDAERQARREHEKAQFAHQAEKLRKVWE